MDTNTRKHLQDHHQEQLLLFWDQLDNDHKNTLLKDINELKLEQVNEYFQRATKEMDTVSQKFDDKMQPVPAEQFGSLLTMDAQTKTDYFNKGLEQISEGRVAVLLMAGGQGTRLGFAFPKGMYNVGLPSGKSLFQIQAERILKLEELAEKETGKRGRIVWYIMTSEHTMHSTMDFFKEHDYFGLQKSDVVMFEQGNLPCYQFDGKIILDKKYRVATAPDGNGGIYRALRDKGILDDLDKRGIVHLHVHSVDNILIRVADPIFIGFCMTKRSDCGVKVVEKSSPTEPVGVVCKVDGLYQVVEYSEITLATAELRNADGKLTFSAGNICNHYFTTEFLKKIANEHESKLKLHIAKKKIPYVDNNGDRHVPDKPNGIKIEKFVFDVFQFAENLTILEVDRTAEFSPLKNADSAGKDCPKTAREDVFSLHRKYVKNAGGIINDDIDVEVSPLLSYAGEGLENEVRGKSFAASPVLIAAANEAETNGKL